MYSCLTCIPEAKTDIEKSAGVCLACTFHCHDGHELIELYTKRNFRCDCGNTKFPNGKCNLYSDKNPVNDMNLYNQNFTGVYCTCHKPYPDPEDNIADEMIQCVVCEDWYHTRHLGVPMPKNFAGIMMMMMITLFLSPLIIFDLTFHLTIIYIFKLIIEHVKILKNNILCS